MPRSEGPNPGRLDYILFDLCKLARYIVALLIVIIGSLVIVEVPVLTNLVHAVLGDYIRHAIIAAGVVSFMSLAAMFHAIDHWTSRPDASPFIQGIERLLIPAYLIGFIICFNTIRHVGPDPYGKGLPAVIFVALVAKLMLVTHLWFIRGYLGRVQARLAYRTKNSSHATPGPNTRHLNW
jgi:hypothetical protein